MPVAQEIGARVAAVADVDDVLFEPQADRGRAHPVARRIGEPALIDCGVRGLHRDDERVDTRRRLRIAGLERVDDRANRDVRGDLTRRVTTHPVAHDVHPEEVVVVHRVFVLGALRADVGAADRAQQEALRRDDARIAHRGTPQLRLHPRHDGSTREFMPSFLVDSFTRRFASGVFSTSVHGNMC